jgi:hypothetical protein
MEIEVDGMTVNVATHPVFTCYATSTDGRVFCRPAVSRRGLPRSGPAAKYTPPYRKCRVTQGGSTKLVSVHRFMLECWQGIQPRNVVVRHLDGKSLNNSLANLKYGTVKENVDDAFRHNGNYAEGSRNGRAKLTESDVLAIRSRYEAGEEINSVAVDYPRVHKMSVFNAAKRITWAHI